MNQIENVFKKTKIETIKCVFTDLVYKVAAMHLMQKHREGNPRKKKRKKIEKKEVKRLLDKLKDRSKLAHA